MTKPISTQNVVDNTAEVEKEVLINEEVEADYGTVIKSFGDIITTQQPTAEIAAETE